jgi:hypothetical protein
MRAAETGRSVAKPQNPKNLFLRGCGLQGAGDGVVGNGEDSSECR